LLSVVVVEQDQVQHPIDLVVVALVDLEHLFKLIH
jgi:hypothetical protein